MLPLDLLPYPTPDPYDRPLPMQHSKHPSIPFTRVLTPIVTPSVSPFSRGGSDRLPLVTPALGHSGSSRALSPQVFTQESYAYQVHCSYEPYPWLHAKLLAGLPGISTNASFAEAVFVAINCSLVWFLTIAFCTHFQDSQQLFHGCKSRRYGTTSFASSSSSLLPLSTSIPMFCRHTTTYAHAYNTTIVKTQISTGAEPTLPKKTLSSRQPAAPLT